ncbi:DUF1684 domain-containing protein [Steroidobacter sp. S1-65]|uniref:DUF1684 domain-containing protein n=1 Tax=Steroidobacter gossypii TaxID=2805490 RepID=A0ABS1WW57_9GAMM|nr:DUF1684 domain-containing protein [Steroidobacter gossypii]MBM0105182.1 DUF1684 domain-containing protein [Steroidobacter gossypii]
MRRLLHGLLVLLAFSCHADDTAGYQEWLKFKQAMQAEAGGPTGMYAIQDMIELGAGESAHLPARQSAEKKDNLRWLKKPASAALAIVKFADQRAIVSGPGIQSTDLLQTQGKAVPLGDGLAVKGTLLRDKTLKLWLYDANLPAKRNFKQLDFYPYDPRGRITGRFRRNEQPVAVSYLDSRDQAGTMYEVGVIEATIEGKQYDLKTVSYKNRWKEIDFLLLLLRDGTSGKTTYGGGRVVEIAIPKGAPPASVTFDLNLAYSFLCAHSEFYNCPLVLTNRVGVELPFGEKFPPQMSNQ